MNTFKKEISYKSKHFDTAKSKWVMKKVKKEVTFSELDETEQSQHRLHFKIMALYKQKMAIIDGEQTGMTLDTDTLYDITVESVKKLVVLDDSFNAQDLKEFTSCSLSLLNFGQWFLGEHVVPFIIEYNSL